MNKKLIIYTLINYLKIKVIDYNTIYIETLKEIIRVKLKDGDETFYKKFNAKDVTLIKSPENEEEDPEEKEHLKELQELEKLEKMDTQNKTDDDI